MRSIRHRKRPVEPDRVEQVVNGIVRRLGLGESEMPPADRRDGHGPLSTLDPVAFVRCLNLPELPGSGDFEDFVGQLGGDTE
jgi:transcriptional repressor NrdR